MNFETFMGFMIILLLITLCVIGFLFVFNKILNLIFNMQYNKKCKDIQKEFLQNHQEFQDIIKLFKKGNTYELHWIDGKYTLRMTESEYQAKACYNKECDKIRQNNTQSIEIKE